MTDTELQAVVNAVKYANGNSHGHKFWGHWGPTVLWIASFAITGFLTWHNMDKRLEFAERKIADTEERVKVMAKDTESIKDTTRRIENALGRVEDVVWKKR